MAILELGRARRGVPDLVVERLAERDEGCSLPTSSRRACRGPASVASLAEQSRRGSDPSRVHVGSAATGVGVDTLLSSIPAVPAGGGRRSDGAELRGRRVQDRARDRRRPRRLRSLFDGAVRARDQCHVRRRRRKREVTAPCRHHAAAASTQLPAAWTRARSRSWSASVASVSATRSVPQREARRSGQFPPPALESVVAPVKAGDGAGCVPRSTARRAGPADQRPPGRRARRDLGLAVSARSRRRSSARRSRGEFGIEVGSRRPRTICIERPVSGRRSRHQLAEPAKSAARAHWQRNPFMATVGLRIEPAQAAPGISFELDVDIGRRPAPHLQDGASVRRSIEGSNGGRRRSRRGSRAGACRTAA